MLNVRVVEVEMRRPLVQAKVSSVHVQVQHCMWSCIEEMMAHKRFIHDVQLCSNTHGAPVNYQVSYVHCLYLYGCVLVVVITCCGSGGVYTNSVH